MVDLLVPCKNLSPFMYRNTFMYLLYLFAWTSQRKSTITGKTTLCNNRCEILVVKDYKKNWVIPEVTKEKWWGGVWGKSNLGS